MIETRNTVNLRNPMIEDLPPNGTLLTSPTGINGWIAGKAACGKILIVIQVAGRNRTQELWPVQLKGYVLADGSRL